MTNEEAIQIAEQRLYTARYNAETLNNEGLRKINENKAEWLSRIICLAKKQIPICGSVEPVRHGKWISVDGDVIFQCSECETVISTGWDYDDPDMFTYCPCCGAKMDEED